MKTQLIKDLAIIESYKSQIFAFFDWIENHLDEQSSGLVEVVIVAPAYINSIFVNPTTYCKLNLH